MSDHVILRGLGVALREPEQVCHGCGATGTIGRIVRSDGEGHVLEVHRYCRACWPEHRSRARERIEAEMRAFVEAIRHAPFEPRPTPSAYAIEGASWDGVIEFIAETCEARRSGQAVSAADLAATCEEWPELEREIGEPMPVAVRAFYDAHRGVAS